MESEQCQEEIKRIYKENFKTYDRELDHICKDLFKSFNKALATWDFSIYDDYPD